MPDPPQFYVAGVLGSDAGLVLPPSGDAGPIGCVASGCACAEVSSCNDGNACTTDSCLGGACAHSAIPGCCVDATTCNDGDSCTTDTCGAVGCEHTPIAGCAGGGPGPVEPPPPATPTARCFMPTPAGAPSAAPPRPYSGTCPTIMPGMNTIRSGGANRSFYVGMPAGYTGATPLPLVVYWHEINGNASSIFQRPEAQAAIDATQTIAVALQSKGDVTFTWPFTVLDNDARINEDVGFFDDVLSCMDQQFNVNNDCVSSIGVSAGALWNAQLVQRRSDRIASFISLSGGVGGVIRGWSSPSRRLPGLVLWGGPTDVLGPVDFHNGSRSLLSGMNGHYAVECVHNCGHGAPPAVLNNVMFIWSFVVEHPYWMPAGQGAWTTLPTNAPEWCGIGSGSARMRSGSC